MKKVLIFLILVLFGSSSFAQNGSVIEGLTIKSSILGREMKYSVYLPYDYKTSNRNYPVLYLLHGYGDDDSGWVQFGEIEHYADNAISKGETTPMVIIMPDGLKSFYINSFDGKQKYEDYFFKELMPAVEKMYRIRNIKRYRAVAGLSMGGYGALVYGLKHPDLFCASAPLSAAVFTDEELEKLDDKTFDNLAGVIYGNGLKSGNRLKDNNQQNSALKLIANTSADSLKMVKWYLDCGDDDFLINGNMAVHSALKSKGVPHSFRVRGGTHNWTYWRSALPDVLKFIGDAFHQ